MSETKRGWRKRFFHGWKSLCSYAEAHFGSGTKLTVLGKKTCSETTSQSFCHRFKCLLTIWAILRLHLWNTLFDGSGTKCTDLKVWKKFLQKLVCVSKVKTSHRLFFSKKCCRDKKNWLLAQIISLTWSYDQVCEILWVSSQKLTLDLELNSLF